MKLKEVFEPVKNLDRYILRQYTKLSKKTGLDKGRRKYHFGIVTVVPNDIFSHMFGVPLIGKMDVPIWYAISLMDQCYSLRGSLGLIKEDETDNVITKNPITEFSKNYNRAIRLPVFAAGATLMGKSGYEIINHFVNGAPVENNTYNQLGYGWYLLSTASSMYIKDTNPKLLDKSYSLVEYLKKAGNAIKKKVSDLLPSPAPQPVPVQYNSLEERI